MKTFRITKAFSLLEMVFGLGIISCLFCTIFACFAYISTQNAQLNNVNQVANLINIISTDVQKKIQEVYQVFESKNMIQCVLCESKKTLESKNLELNFIESADNKNAAFYINITKNKDDKLYDSLLNKPFVSFFVEAYHQQPIHNTSPVVSFSIIMQ